MSLISLSFSGSCGTLISGIQNCRSIRREALQQIWRVSSGWCVQGRSRMLLSCVRGYLGPVLAQWPQCCPPQTGLKCSSGAKVSCLLNLIILPRQPFFLCFSALLINVDFRVFPSNECMIFDTKVFTCAGVGSVDLTAVRNGASVWK